MSSMARVHAQLQILARLLGAQEAQIASLERLTAEEVEALRSAISDYMFDDLAPIFARVNKVVPMIPDYLAAKVLTMVVPPEVAGRGAGAVASDHAHRANGILKVVSPRYLADAAPYIDPRAIPTVVPEVKGELVGPAARELLRRGDYVTAARFVEFATPRLIDEMHECLDDDEGILLAGALVMSAERVSDILRAVPEERRRRIGQVIASADDQVVVAALTVLERIEDSVAREVAQAWFAALDGEGVARVVVLAGERDLGFELESVSRLLDSDDSDRLAAASGLE